MMKVTAVELAQIAKNGASAITVHEEQECKCIRARLTVINCKSKKAVDIPVIANGDITDERIGGNYA
ncbi:MAG: tRNA-dihydrouridine synthase [Eubacterium sp.]